jgi:hypothetical protein
MKWSRHRRARRAAGSQKSGGRDRSASKGDLKHLHDWAAERRGVEAFVEPQTTVSATTILLVAHDGEWTRRRVASPKAARDFAEGLSMPIYDAAVVGYPQRMREWQRRHGPSSGRRVL